MSTNAERLIERLQAKLDWFNGKYSLDLPEDKRPAYETSVQILTDTIDYLKKVDGLNKSLIDRYSILKGAYEQSEEHIEQIEKRLEEMAEICKETVKSEKV